MNEIPHKAYALIIAAYLFVFGLLASLVRREPQRLREMPPARELAVLGLATYRLSRLIAHDRVTSVLRLPFIEEGAGDEQIEGTQEEPKGTGLQLAIGQLLTCSWCASIWAGTLNVSAFTLFPRIGRMFVMILAASGAAEFLDPVFPMLNYLSGYIRQKQEAQKDS